MKMQAGGQYALPEVHQRQFNVNRSSDASASHGHIFVVGNEMSPSSSLPKSHSNHAQHLNNHLHLQQPTHQQHQHQHQQPPAQSQHHPQPSFQVTQQDHHQIHQQSNPLQELQKDQNQQGKYLQQQQLGFLSDSAQAPAALATRPPISSVKQMNPTSGEHVADDDEGLEDGERVAGGNRWPRQETLVLIKIRSEMDSSFRDCAVKGPLWEEVSRKLSEQGYGQRNGRKCKEKFENIYKYYKKTKEGRAGRQDGKNYRFFAELEALYGSDMNNDTRAGGENGKGSQVAGGSISLFKLKEGANDRVAEGVSSAQRPLETGVEVNLSSETSEEEYDEPGDMEYTDSRKRKRKLWSKRMLLFEKILKRFFEKQEELQRKFFDALERREQDRFAREEAWKRQETARLNREYDLRAQEHALAVTRNSTLVAYMQRISGQKVHLPDIAPPLSNSDPMQMQEEQREKDRSDPNRRWPKPEVQALIRVRGNLEPKFQDAGPKGSLWEEVAAGMTRLGYNRNAKRCKEKWENINKYFRKSKDSSKKRSENAKTCQYFNQLDDLYRKGVLVSPSSKLIKSGDPTDDQPEKAGVGNVEDTVQGAHDEGEVEILTTVPIADSVAEEEIPSDSAHVKILSVDPENADPDGDREQPRADDGLSLAAEASTGISAHASLALAFDSLNGDEMFPGINSKSHKVEGLAKGFLETQNLSEFETNTEQQEMMDQDTREARDLEVGSEETLPSTRDGHDIDSFTVT